MLKPKRRQSDQPRINGKYTRFNDDDDAHQSGQPNVRSPTFSRDLDLIFRTSDGAELECASIHLCSASEIFYNMFSSGSNSASQEKKNGRPVISLAETSLTVKIFLHYANYDPDHRWTDPIPTISDILLLCDMCDKYQAPGLAHHALQDLLRHHLGRSWEGVLPPDREGSPVVVLAIALRYGVDDRARQAIRAQQYWGWGTTGTGRRVLMHVKESMSRFGMDASEGVQPDGLGYLSEEMRDRISTKHQLRCYELRDKVLAGPGSYSWGKAGDDFKVRPHLSISF